jgi:chemotaxis protein CheD
MKSFLTTKKWKYSDNSKKDISEKNYFVESYQMKKLFLYPAALYADKEPTEVVTILGSCVSVCLWDPVKMIGGINHFMLPLWSGQGLASPRYGDIAIEKLIAHLSDLGSLKRNLKAKVFGGGEVLDFKNASFNIGARNIEIALATLNEQSIPIVAKSVGGKFGRKILFFSETGEVRMKFVGKDKESGNVS